MVIFREDKSLQLECGINDDGDLFMSQGRSGYNLPDTDENRDYVIADFEWHVKREERFRKYGY